MRTFMLAALGGLICAGAAAAQAPEAAPAAGRADFQAVLGWQNLRLDRYDDPFDRPDHNWAHSILYGGAGAGWYWTEHLKTQVEVGGGTPTRHYRYRLRTINGLQASEISRVRLTRPSHLSAIPVLPQSMVPSAARPGTRYRARDADGALRAGLRL
jgi:hypothetical protein